jgi:hypothetical protein
VDRIKKRAGSGTDTANKRDEIGGVRRATPLYRFSTDKQNEKSTDDQAALSRDCIQKNGFEVVCLYEDKAKSGALILNREGHPCAMIRCQARRLRRCAYRKSRQTFAPPIRHSSAL